MHKLAPVLLAALLGLALSACGATSPATPESSTAPTSAALAEPTSAAVPAPTAEGNAGQAAVITIDEIQAAADNWYGRPVTVNGDVAQIYNELAFSISGTDAAAGPLLVIMPSGASLSPGQSVEVSGVIQQLDVAQIQQDLGVTLGPEVETLTSQPVLIADQIGG